MGDFYIALFYPIICIQIRLSNFKLLHKINRKKIPLKKPAAKTTFCQTLRGAPYFRGS